MIPEYKSVSSEAIVGWISFLFKGVVFVLPTYSELSDSRVLHEAVYLTASQRLGQSVDRDQNSVSQ